MRISRLLLAGALAALCPRLALAQEGRVVSPSAASVAAPAEARLAQAVDVDFAALAAAARAGRTVSIDVGSALLTTSADRVDWRGAGRFTWFGPIAGGGRATITVEGAYVYARLHHAAGLVVIEPSGDGHVAYSPAPIEGEGDDTLPARSDAGPAGGGEDELFPDELHIALFYTSQVTDSLGGAVGAFMQATSDQITDVLANSNVDFRARLVHTSEVAIFEEPTLSGSLFALLDHEPVHHIRDAASADLVAMLVETGTNSATSCGVAFLMSSLDPGFESSAFSVTKRRCAPDLVFAHEVGHNLGLHHDVLVAPGPGLFNYSHGYVNIDSMNVPPGRPGIRTPLAYHQACANAGGECTRIPYYSTVEQLYNGQVIGDAATADNTRTVRQSAPLAATFRAPIRLTTEAGTTTGAPVWNRPECPDPADPSSCVPSGQATAVPWVATPFEVSSAGRHYLRSAAGFDGVLVLYEGAFNPDAPFSGIVGYAELDASAPASRRLLLSADLAVSQPYVLVTTGMTNGDAGAFENAFFGPAGGGIVLATDADAPPSAFTLGRVVPNPARVSAVVGLSAASTQRVAIEVFDLLGRRVAAVYDGWITAGTTPVTISVEELEAGMYAVRATSDSGVQTVRLSVVR